MSQRHVAKNTAYFTGALILQKILSFGYFWLISSAIFPAELGQYTFALSFSTLIAIIVDLGLSPVLTREAARKPEQANRLLRNVIGCKLPLAVLAAVTAGVIMHFSGKPVEMQYLVYLATAVAIIDSFSFSFWMIFRSRQLMHYESVNTVIIQAVIFGLGFIAVKYNAGVSALIAALLVASIYNLIVSAGLLRYRLHFSLAPLWERDTIRLFLKLLPAFALAGIFLRVYNAADTVILSYAVSDHSVGLYAIPAKVISSLQQVIPGAFAAVIYPVFSNYYAHDREKLSRAFHYSIIYLFALALPLTVGLITLLPEILTRVWPAYQEILPTFIIMALSIPFIFLAFPTGYLLNAADQERKTTLNRGIIAVASVGLNIALIPVYGVVGAGITYLATNIGLLMLDFWWIRRVVVVRAADWLPMLLKVVGATAAMLVAVVLLKSMVSVFLVAAIGGVVYFAMLSMLVGQQDRASAKALIFRRS
jgi:O-antigen/teichoic acid export membrane protein